VTALETIAYQGVPGAFSEIAAREFARGGAPAEFLPCPRFEDLFEAVCSGRTDASVVPIENTLSGSVHACYDLLARYEVTVEGEAVVRVEHALIAPPGVAFADVRRVLSHPVALLQCERFFRENPVIEAVAVYDTAAAVKEVVSNGRRDSAAIAGRPAARAYGGVILAENLEDDPENFTRFLLVRRPGDRPARPPGASGLLKTSLLFRTANRPGALFECLSPFALNGINLAKIESRPVRGTRFEYLFYLDAVAPPDRAQDLDRAVQALARSSTDLRRLGTYAAATEPVTVGASA
jgi:prephenate dehydratase